MIITCEHCQTRFKVPDEKLAQGPIRMRCGKCNHVFAAGAATGAPASGPTAAASSGPRADSTAASAAPSFGAAPAPSVRSMPTAPHAASALAAPLADPFATIGAAPAQASTARAAPSSPQDPFAQLAPRPPVDPFATLAPKANPALQPPAATSSHGSADPFAALGKPPPPADLFGGDSAPTFGVDALSSSGPANPFAAAAPKPRAVDPFAYVASKPSVDPFASLAGNSLPAKAASAADPFASLAPNARPSGPTAPSASVDPFASLGPKAPSDPFASIAARPAADPFTAIASKVPASDPFASIAQPARPSVDAFAAPPPPSADPFARQSPPKSATPGIDIFAERPPPGFDPFAIRPATSTAKSTTTTDPFASSFPDPFAPKAAALAPAPTNDRFAVVAPTPSGAATSFPAPPIADPFAPAPSTKALSASSTAPPLPAEAAREDDSFASLGLELDTPSALGAPGPSRAAPSNSLAPAERSPEPSSVAAAAVAVDVADGAPPAPSRRSVESARARAAPIFGAVAVCCQVVLLTGSVVGAVLWGRGGIPVAAPGPVVESMRLTRRHLPAGFDVVVVSGIVAQGTGAPSAVRVDALFEDGDKAAGWVRRNPSALAVADVVDVKELAALVGPDPGAPPLSPGERARFVIVAPAPPEGSAVSVAAFAGNATP